MILIFEVFFIKENIGRFNELYKQVAMENLRGDANLIKNLADRNTSEEFSEILSETNKRFTLIGEAGEVVFDSEKFGEEETLENHSSRPEVEEALKNGSGFSIRESSSVEKLMAYYAMKYDSTDGNTYVIRTSRDFRGDRDTIYKILGIEVVFFILLNAFIYYTYKTKLKGHLFKRVGDIKKALELGDEVKEIYSKGDSWLVEFWKVVKEWQSENLENIRLMELERKRLKRIIASVDQAVILIDSELKVIMRNNALNYLFRKNRNNYYYLEVKHIEIIDIIKRCEKTKESIKDEIYMADLKKYLLVNVRYLDQNNQYIVTIKDITRSKEMLEVQKSFISNISHELKTPLTNIKGYLIALEDAPKEMQDYFLGVAKNNVDKLENIIMDFLNISKYENSKVINVSQVSFDKIRKNLEMTVDSYIKNKNARINYSINLLDENEFLIIDEEKISTVLKNLIENAIIYNENEMPKVYLEIMELYDCYKFTVRDNGIGIAASELENIFERFYRVDKARTSNIAGTGLGLSIVSEIINTLGGKLHVESEEGRGTIFTFKILK